MSEHTSSNTEAEIRAKQEEWMNAWVAGDRPTLERILAPEFALIVSANPTAQVTRDAWLATAIDGYRATSFGYDGMQVRQLGDVMIASSIATQRATAFGKDRSGTFFLTDVWRRGANGDWQVIARYSSHPEPKTASAVALDDAATAHDSTR